MSWGSHGKPGLMWLSPKIHAFITAELYLLRPGQNLAAWLFSMLLSISEGNCHKVSILLSRSLKRTSGGPFR